MRAGASADYAVQLPTRPNLPELWQALSGSELSRRYIWRATGLSFGTPNWRCEKASLRHRAISSSKYSRHDLRDHLPTTTAEIAQAASVVRTSRRIHSLKFEVSASRSRHLSESLLSAFLVCVAQPACRPPARTLTNYRKRKLQTNRAPKLI